MKFHERLKCLRVQADLTQKQLSECIGVSVMAVRNWETGAKQPSMHAIISLADVLHTSADVLLGIRNDTRLANGPASWEEADLLEDYRALDSYGRHVVDAVCTLERARFEETKRKTPVTVRRVTEPARYIPKYLTPSAAGYSVPLDGEDFEMLLVDDDVPAAADFAVKIQGDSMSPWIHDGDTVYVERTSELKLGDIGIFNVNGAMYCKMYYVDAEGNMTLLSTNPAMRLSNVTVSADGGDTVVCYGKVLLDKPTHFPDYFHTSG